METADRHIRVAAEQFPVAVQNVEDAVVGAARQQNMLPFPGDDQALFVGKIVLHQAAVGGRCLQFPVAFRPEAPPRNAGEEEKLLIQTAVALQQMQVGQLQDGFVDADIAVAVVKVPRCPPLHIDLRPGRQFRQAQEAPGVVVVAVAEHHRVHPGEVQSQGGGIVRKGAGGTGVQQQSVAGGLDVETQPVFMGAPRRAGGVLDERDDPHGPFLPFLVPV